MYTAYTFIAVPALVFGVGAAGFYALPTRSWCSRSCWCCARLWSIAGCTLLTPADLVKALYGSRGLSVAVR